MESILNDLGNLPGLAWGVTAVALALGAVLGRAVWPRAARTVQLAEEEFDPLFERLDRSDASAREEARISRQELGQQFSGFAEGLRRETAESRKTLDGRLDDFGKLQSEIAGVARTDLRNTVGQFGETLKGDLSARMDQFQKGLGERQSGFEKALADKFEIVAKQIEQLSKGNTEAQEKLRTQVEAKLEGLRQANEAKLEQMRLTVDEKLQGTLEKRLGESFKLVSERLEHVQRGLGEMQSLAVGVGDLKRVLSNVKDRGGWAEIRLGALLEQMLTADQFEQNVKINPSSNEIVEYAIRLPGKEDEDDVFLPVDAKFPKEDYERLEAAWEAGNLEGAKTASDAIARTIEQEAKRIGSKYICPPHSTDFAVMFLPTEGLFAEAMRMPGLAEKVQTKYRVTLTGPTTLSALLNSLQMGFRTLAVQKRSSEVWQVLGHAKAEFRKYGLVWEKLQKQLSTAQNTVEEAGKRTRAVERRLRTVEEIERPDTEPAPLELAEAFEHAEEDALSLFPKAVRP